MRFSFSFWAVNVAVNQQVGKIIVSRRRKQGDSTINGRIMDAEIQKKTTIERIQIQIQIQTEIQIPSHETFGAHEKQTGLNRFACYLFLLAKPYSFN